MSSERPDARDDSIKRTTLGILDTGAYNSLCANPVTNPTGNLKFFESRLVASERASFRLTTAAPFNGCDRFPEKDSRQQPIEPIALASVAHLEGLGEFLFQTAPDLREL